jgi:hypothetical protein
MFGITQLLTDKPKFNCRSIWLLCEWFNLCVKFSWEPCWDSPGEINFQSTHSTKEMQKKLSTNEWDKQVRQAGSSHRDREWWMTDCLPAHPVKAQPHGWLRVRRTNTRNWSGIDLRCPLLSSCGGYKLLQLLGNCSSVRSHHSAVPGVTFSKALEFKQGLVTSGVPKVQESCINFSWVDVVVHACNPSYLGGRAHSLRTAREEKVLRPKCS